MVFGTFDMLHSGHRHFLMQAKEHGDFLIAVVARDTNVLKYKGKAPVQKEDKRLEHVNTLPFVDRAFLGRKDHDYIKLLRQTKPDIICLGYDQHSFGLKDQLEKNSLDIKVIRLRPYKQNLFKSSIIRHLLKI